MSDNSSKDSKNEYLREELNIDQKALNKLKKKLKKIEPRSDRGVETLFRLLSKNQYTLNTMIDRKSNILISINAIILSIILSVALNQISRDPHLLYAIVIMLTTNLWSITYAVMATRPELNHGKRQVNNLLFYGNFVEMPEEEYLENIDALMNQGDDLYKAIAKDTYYLGKVMDKKFKLIRKSFNVFLIGIILAVVAFLLCHLLFEGMI